MMMRREQAERTREILLDAAAEEFWLHGLGGARIQDILDRAQMTKGGLYHHFTGKHELAVALTEAEATRWPESTDRVAASGARGLTALRSFSLELAETLTVQVRARAVVRIAEELDTNEAHSAFVIWHDFVILCLQQAIADGEVADSIPIRDAATSIIEALYGVAASPAPMTHHTSSPTRVLALWNLLEAGLGVIGR